MLTVTSGDVVTRPRPGPGYVSIRRAGAVYVPCAVARQWADGLGGGLPEYVTIGVPEHGTLVLLPADGPGVASYRLTHIYPDRLGGSVWAVRALAEAGIAHDHTRAVPASVEAVQGPEGITPAVVVRAGDR